MEGSRFDKEEDVADVPKAASNRAAEAFAWFDLVIVGTGEGEKYRMDSFIRCSEESASEDVWKSYGAFLSWGVGAEDGGALLVDSLSSGEREGFRGADVAVVS